MREKYDQISNQLEEKLQNLRENKHAEIDHLNSKQEALRLSEDTKVTKEESNMFSSEHIESKVINIASENASFKNHFDKKSQAKFATYDQSFDTKEENLIEFQGKQHM